jgi:hypothetical protein
VILNPAVAGNVYRGVVISTGLLRRHLTSQEESHPDQERHAHNQRRGQYRQVREDGSLLSAGLPLNQFAWPRDHLVTVIQLTAAPALRRTHAAATYAFLPMTKADAATPRAHGRQAR